MIIFITAACDKQFQTKFFIDQASVLFATGGEKIIADLKGEKIT